jgi:hypothetical protein
VVHKRQSLAAFVTGLPGATVDLQQHRAILPPGDRYRASGVR